MQALALEQDKARGIAEHTIDNINPQVGDGERDQARADLARLPAQAKQQRAIIEQDNAHPLDAYKQRLKAATDSTKDAVQQVEVNALGKLEDQLSSSLTKVLGLKGAFGDLFGSILADLAKIEIEKGLLSVLGGKPGASSGGGISGFFGSLAGLFGGGGNAAAGLQAGADSYASSFSAGIPGFAAGGSAIIGGNPGIDQNLLSINGKPSLRVGKGETLSVTPNLGPVNQRVAPSYSTTVVQQTIHVDGRNSVTPEGFADQIVRTANAHANRVAATAGQRAAEASPAVVQRIRTLGT